MALLLLLGLWSARLLMCSLPTVDVLAFRELPGRAIGLTSEENNQVPLAVCLADRTCQSISHDMTVEIQITRHEDYRFS
jgi:hypothetical protein